MQKPPLESLTRITATTHDISNMKMTWLQCNSLLARQSKAQLWQKICNQLEAFRICYCL